MRYPMYINSPEAYYETREVDGGWVWAWVEPGEADDISEVYPTESQALEAAADDAQMSVTNCPSRKVLVVRLRNAAKREAQK